MFSSLPTKAELLEILDHWDDNLNAEHGKPIWEYMGWTKEKFRQWITQRKDLT